MTTDRTLARIIAARAALVLDQPFFGVLALHLRIELDATCDTAWTDGRSLGFSPAFVATLTADELKALIAHEVMHCACGHPWRRDGREHSQWNVAADHAINHVLRDAGFELPAGALMDPQFAGRHAEWIYDRLPQPQPGPQGSQGSQGQPQPQPGPQGSQGQPQPQPGPQGSQGQPQPQPGPQGSQGQPQPQPGPQGSQGQPQPQPGPQGSQGQPQPQPGPQGNPQGEVRDAPADAEPDAPTEADWKEITAQAQAQGRGTLSAGASRGVSELRRPIVDWRSTLRRFFQETCAADYTWTRPSTRYLASGLFLPSLRSEACGTIVVAIDTSGSIDRVLLSQFETELRSIVAEIKPRIVHVIYCDYDVCGADEFGPDDTITLVPHGGGGTRFSPVFEHVDAEGIEPVALVYMTDLDGPLPAAPAYPVLWASTDPDARASFGEVVALR